MEGVAPLLGQDPPRVIGLALVVVLIGLEYGWNRWRGRSSYDPGETAATLVIALGQRLIGALLAGAAVAPLSWVYGHRLWDLPVDQGWSLGLLFLGVECAYYWHHRAMHRFRWLWATHQVHHSATRFNLSCALRLGWGGPITGAVLFYLPLVWLGFHPAAVLGMLAASLFFQFFLHLAHAPGLGPLEWVLNTPRHHRVHHAANTACLDRNFGGMVIVFDRLFGTFAAAPAGEALRYGLAGVAGPSRHPFAVALTGWRDVAGRLWRARDWRDRLEAVAGRP